MRDRFTPAVHAPDGSPNCAYFFAFCGDLLLVRKDTHGRASVPRLHGMEELGLPARKQHYLGYSDRFGHCVAVELPPGQPPPHGLGFSGLRALYGDLDEDLLWIGGRAVQIVAWYRDHQYCGRCGRPTHDHPSERARVCSACSKMFFPRLAPAIIVLIHRGNEFLLARNHRFPSGRYSIIAGFVEAGENLEEAVRREVREEVDIEIADIRYFGSQPWPFPNSLMVGFTAAYAGGQIHLADGELADADWYPRNRSRLPELPDGLSISRRLIEAYLDGRCCP